MPFSVRFVLPVVVCIFAGSAPGCGDDSASADAGDTDAVDETTLDDGVTEVPDDAAAEDAPPPPPGSVLVTERLVNLDGTAWTDLPITVAHAFAEGHAVAGASLRVAGATDPLPTQLDVKRRWPDGSVRFALLSAVLPTLPAAGAVELEVLNAPATVRGMTPGPEALLEQTDLEAAVTFATGAGAFAAALRERLAAGDATSWISGPLAVEYHLDGPPADAGGAGHPQLGVSFRVRWYPSRPGTARIEVAVDNVRAEARGDVVYDLTLTRGATAATAYERSGVVHFHNARWRKVVWWGEPYPELNYEYDIDYLIGTGLLPKWDTSLVVDEDAIASQHATWLAAPREILENGPIEAYFPTTGGRDDIGPYPAWAVRYLLSMDPRAREVTLGCGDLAGSFSIHLLERATGRVVSIDDRPECSPWGDQRYADPADVLPAPVGEETSPYSTDNAHQPSLAYVPYLVTGDRWYLEELYFWASYVMLSQSYSTEWGRNRDAGLVRGDQVRGQAWALRQLGDAAALALDDSWELDYFTAKLENNLDWYAAEMLGPPPSNALGWWGAQSNRGEDGGRPDESMAADVRYYTSPWMSDFLVWSFDHLAELGYADAAVSRDWLAAYLVGRFRHGPEFNPYDGAPYHLAVLAEDGSEYADWTTVWQKSFAGRTDPAPTAFADASCAMCYPMIARGALAAAERAELPGAATARAFLSDNLVLESLADNPQWALVP
ncbi:MAG: hypothetical protein JXB32_13425 [Deltaproteobacteria bacterium]|nr:hypothetical protein [Deltaproteobacteria bacterium]